MCLGDWKTHGSEYYECSRYKENPDIVNQSQQAQAREALKKYLFYFERVRHRNTRRQKKFREAVNNPWLVSGYHLNDFLYVSVVIS